jgi:hypothetical protein
MTTTFDKREEGFEKQFAHDEELRFKAMARRNKMLGLWAAGILGKSGPDAEAYAKEVVLPTSKAATTTSRTSSSRTCSRRASPSSKFDCE